MASHSANGVGYRRKYLSYEVAEGHIADRLPPPRLATRFLRWYCHPDLLDEVEGDLHELFQRRVETKGGWRAKVLYCINVLMFLHPDYLRKRKYRPTNHTAMFRKHFTIALRNLLNKKVYATLNILGLAIGLACCLLIFQYVSFEYSFDTFNENSTTLYRINQTTVQGGGEPDFEATVGWAMAPALAQEVPEVHRFVRLHPEYFNAIISPPDQPDKVFEEDEVYYADTTFFQMFSYPLISGHPTRALESGTVMLSESAARKYFGDEDPMGQSLDVRGWVRSTYRVSGVFRDVPANSHLQFEVLLPMVDLLEKSGFSDPDTGWGWSNFIAYVQLHEQADTKAVAEKFTQIVTRYLEEEWRPTNTTGQVNIQPLPDVHLNADMAAPKSVMGSYRLVYFFSVIGLAILFIALVNYVNLTTARALDRAREVGVRKVIGAHRGQLVVQFLAESALVIFTAFVLAVGLAEIFRPMLNELAGLHLTQSLWMSSGFWVAFFTLFCVTLLLAGLYPALVLSSFRPAAVLKGKVSRAASGGWLRHGLVVFQFTATIVLLIGITVVYAQLNHMRTRDLGIDLEQILTVSSPRVLPEGTDWSAAVETFIQELRQLSVVRQTATSGTVPGKGFNYYTGGIRKATDPPSVGVSGVGTRIDTSFAALYGMELIAGDGFDHNTAPATEALQPVVINESAVYALGFDTPADAINQDINVMDQMTRIVGVFKDFDWSSAHAARENIFFSLFQGNSQISIKVSADDLPQTVATVEKLYQQQFPGNPFQYAFADETFDAQYRKDQQFAKLISIFAVLAIVIACLGLFGLAAFTAEQRTKEIGIRKVLGASVPGVVSLLAKNFMSTVALSFLLASPLAWYAMDQWLQDFSYRVDIEWWMFGGAGVLVLLIALFTVSFQSIKAALANPVDSLRSE